MNQCDNCWKLLSEGDFSGYGSWSYKCPECGFKYNHSSDVSLSDQIAEFLYPKTKQMIDNLIEQYYEVLVELADK